MSTSLVAAGLLMGLASTPHCALMCGAPCAAIARRFGGPRSTRALLAWHAGRAAAYTGAGAVAATAVGLLASWSAGSALVRPLWTMLQSAVLVLGLVLLLSGRAPAWANGASQRLAGRALVRGLRAAAPGMSTPKATALRRPPRRWGARKLEAARRFLERHRRAALIGLGWVAMPCAVLYGALAVAALAAGPWEGAAVMAAFSLGSAPGLAGIPLLWARLSRMPQTAALRVAGAMLAAGSVWALWHGLEGASGAWCLPN